MEKASGLKVEYVKPRENNPKDEHKRLVKFVTLFAQVGFKELYLKKKKKIKLDYSK